MRKNYLDIERDKNHPKKSPKFESKSFFEESKSNNVKQKYVTGNDENGRKRFDVHRLQREVDGSGQ